MTASASRAKCYAVGSPLERGVRPRRAGVANFVESIRQLKGAPPTSEEAISQGKQLVEKSTS